MPVVAAEDLRRNYDGTVALSGVSLSVDAGEVFVLVGPNGAGKTTLVRALTGTTRVEGAVTVFGDPPRDVDRERIGVLPQSFRPADRLTARELIAYYGGLYADARAPEAVLADVGLTEATDSHYENLSGGQRRRTCVGTTLVNDPDLLVLDEPTTGIDPVGRRSLWSLLEDLADVGVTIILTTHDMAEAERLADRVGLLADGSLVAVDTPDALIEAYGGDSRLHVEGAVDDADAESLSARLEYEVVRDGTELVVRDVPAVEVGRVAAELTDAGVAYDALTWTEPDLESAYLELTDGEGGDR